MIALGFFALTTAAAIAQARSLRNAARGQAHPAGFLLRLAVVAVALTWAASAGHLIAGACGWALGFGMSVFTFARRWT